VSLLMSSSAAGSVLGCAVQSRQVDELEAAREELEARLAAQSAELAARDVRLAAALRQLSVAKALLQARQRCAACSLTMSSPACCVISDATP
jgi:hypothetical protein